MDIAARDAINQWLHDPEFAEMHPKLMKEKDRLEETLDQSRLAFVLSDLDLTIQK